MALPEKEAAPSALDLSQIYNSSLFEGIGHTQQQRLV